MAPHRESQPQQVDYSEARHQRGGLLRYRHLARLTTYSVRTLKRKVASGDVPGAFVKGRSVFFFGDVIAEWIALGMPDARAWAKVQAAKSHDAAPRAGRRGRHVG